MKFLVWFNHFQDKLRQYIIQMFIVNIYVNGDIRINYENGK